MTNLRPIRFTQKLPEYGDCLFALQTDEPCEGDEGPFGIFEHGPTPTLLRYCSGGQDPHPPGSTLLVSSHSDQGYTLHTHTPRRLPTDPHTYTHNDKLITISSPPCYVVVADNRPTRRCIWRCAADTFRSPRPRPMGRGRGGPGEKSSSSLVLLQNVVALYEGVLLCSSSKLLGELIGRLGLGSVAI